MILDLLPFYKKEKINYNSEKESINIEYERLKSILEEKKEEAIAEDLMQKEYDKKKFLFFSYNSKVSKKQEIDTFFKKELESLERKNKEDKLKAKINYMLAVSQLKEIKENIKLTRKSKSNLHQILFAYSKLSYDTKKLSLVVGEISPSRELMFSIKKRVFKDLNAFNDRSDDRVYAGEKDILFMNIRLGNGNEKIPVVFRYSGECVPIFLEKIRDDTFDKFSSENEHHIMLLSERLREIKAPKTALKIGKIGGMIIIGAVLMIGYLVYKYYNGGF